MKNWRFTIYYTTRVSALIGFKMAMAVCKSVGTEASVVEDSYCDGNSKPEKTTMPCNTHPCTTKWVLLSELTKVNCLYLCNRIACTFYVKGKNEPSTMYIHRTVTTCNQEVLHVPRGRLISTEPFHWSIKFMKKTIASLVCVIYIIFPRLPITINLIP